jgi:hypothetical protein
MQSQRDRYSVLDLPDSFNIQPLLLLGDRRLRLSLGNEHDFSFLPRPHTFQHQMGFSRLRKRQHRPHVRSELSAIEERCKFRKPLTGDFDQKEGGFDTITVGETGIGSRHCRDQLTAAPEHLKRACLRLASDQIDDRINIPDGLLEALLFEIDHCIRAEGAHEAGIIRAGGGDSPQTGSRGDLDRKSSDVSGGPVNDNGLAALEVGLIEQRLPCRYRDDGNRSCFNEGK